MRMFLQTWEGSFGLRVYVKRAMYEGLHFHTRGNHLCWSSKHRARLMNAGGDSYLFFTDLQLKRETALMTDIAEGLGMRLGQELSDEDIDRLRQFGHAKRKVYSGRHLQGALLRAEAAAMKEGVA